MRYLNLTLPSLAENLALDEALLDEAEAAGEPRETLRIWESPTLGVVVGRSSRIAVEVCGDACRARQIPVLRRISGGAAVVVGPGCLMYALVLSLQLRPRLRSIDQAHADVLGTIAAALRQALAVPPSGGIDPVPPKGGTPAADLAMQGTCDLAVGDKKVSGNSVRCRRDHLLYHGTLLYDFPLEMVGQLLAMPPRQPEYRNARAHEAFVMNLPLDAAAIRQALCSAWGAAEACGDWPRAETARLAAEKYSRREWNEQL
jgi:lipoate---protein ligase